jgi:hypothetical protein
MGLTKPLFSSGSSSWIGSGALVVLLVVSPLRKLALMLGSRFWLTCLLALVMALCCGRGPEEGPFSLPKK